MNPDNGRAAVTAETRFEELSPQETLDRTIPLDPADLVLRLSALKQPLDLKDLIGDIERGIIFGVLTNVHGNQKAAARLLGLKPTTLNEKVKRFGIRFRKYPLS